MTSSSHHFKNTIWMIYYWGCLYIYSPYHIHCIYLCVQYLVIWIRLSVFITASYHSPGVNVWLYRRNSLVFIQIQLIRYPNLHGLTLCVLFLILHVKLFNFVENFMSLSLLISRMVLILLSITLSIYTRYIAERCWEGGGFHRQPKMCSVYKLPYSWLRTTAVSWWRLEICHFCSTLLPVINIFFHIIIFFFFFRICVRPMFGWILYSWRTLIGEEQGNLIKNLKQYKVLAFR